MNMKQRRNQAEFIAREAYSRTYAIKVLRNNAGKQFEPEVVKIFIEQVLAELPETK